MEKLLRNSKITSDAPTSQHLVSKTHPSVVDRITFSGKKVDDLHKKKNHGMIIYIRSLII